MKITVGQLRRIIREEVEQEKLRKIVRESAESALEEGIWDNIRDLASATFTGKVQGKDIPKGVDKGMWVGIMQAAQKLPPERRSAYIADATMQARESGNKSYISANSWLKNAVAEEEEVAQMNASEKARYDARMKARAAVERDNAAMAARIASYERDMQKFRDKEQAEKEKREREDLDRMLRRGKAPYNPSGSSSMGRMTDAW